MLPRTEINRCLRLYFVVHTRWGAGAESDCLLLAVWRMEEWECENSWLIPCKKFADNSLKSTLHQLRCYDSLKHTCKIKIFYVLSTAICRVSRHGYLHPLTTKEMTFLLLYRFIDPFRDLTTSGNGLSVDALIINEKKEREVQIIFCRRSKSNRSTTKSRFLK